MRARSGHLDNSQPSRSTGKRKAYIVLKKGVGRQHNDGIRKNPWVFPFPLFLPHPTTTHRTILVCLHLRDTNMADSNRCQAVGHVGENQELSPNMFDSLC